MMPGIRWRTYDQSSAAIIGAGIVWTSASPTTDRAISRTRSKTPASLTVTG